MKLFLNISVLAIWFNVSMKSGNIKKDEKRFTAKKEFFRFLVCFMSNENNEFYETHDSAMLMLIQMKVSI